MADDLELNVNHWLHSLMIQTSWANCWVFMVTEWITMEPVLNHNSHIEHQDQPHSHLNSHAYTSMLPKEDSPFINISLMSGEITENPLQKPINPHIHAINDSYTDPTPWARMQSVMKSYPVKHSLAVVCVIAHLTENWSGLVSVNFDFNLIVLTSYLNNTVIPRWVVWGGIWKGWVRFKSFKEFDSRCTKSNTPRPISF